MIYILSFLIFFFTLLCSGILAAIITGELIAWHLILTFSAIVALIAATIETIMSFLDSKVEDRR